MAVGNIFQVKLSFDMPTPEPGVSVFWYRATAGAATTADNLRQVFDLLVRTQLSNIFPSNVNMTTLQVLNTSDFGDNVIFTYSPEIAGQEAGMLDVTQAIAFRKRTGGIGTRYSYKRFPAPGLLAPNQRTWPNAGGTFLGSLQLVASRLGLELSDGTNAYLPIQVKGGWTMTCTASNPSYCGEDAVIENGTLQGMWSYDRYPSHQDTRNESDWFTPAAP